MYSRVVIRCSTPAKVHQKFDANLMVILHDTTIQIHLSFTMHELFDEHMRSIFLLSSSLSGVSKRSKKTYEKFNLHLQINKIILININQVLVEKTVTIYQFFVHC